MKSKAIIACVIALILIILASRASAQDSCFPLGYAYLNWRTVLREEPGFGGQIIDLNNVGLRIVQDTKRFLGNCWVLLKSDSDPSGGGWLLAENLNAIRLRIMDNDERFQAQIISGLNYLGEYEPRWFLYVVQHEYIIEPAKSGETSSTFEPESWTVRIHENAFASDLRLAAHLVHEACHVHQAKAGRLPLEAFAIYIRVRLEQECVAREVEMASDIAPDDSLVQERWRVLAQPYWWWLRDIREYAADTPVVKS